MELKEFIKATVTAIAESVEELGGELGDKIIINPNNMYFVDQMNGSSDKFYTIVKKEIDGQTNSYKYLIQNIEFNLAISDVTKNESGGGLNIEVFKAGMNITTGTENHNTVKFSIPVAFLK